MTPRQKPHRSSDLGFRRWFQAMSSSSLSAVPTDSPNGFPRMWRRESSSGSNRNDWDCTAVDGGCTKRQPMPSSYQTNNVQKDIKETAIPLIWLTNSLWISWLLLVPSVNICCKGGWRKCRRRAVLEVSGCLGTLCERRIDITHIPGVQTLFQWVLYTWYNLAASCFPFCMCFCLHLGARGSPPNSKDESAKVQSHYPKIASGKNAILANCKLHYASLVYIVSVSSYS